MVGQSGQGILVRHGGVVAEGIDDGHEGAGAPQEAKYGIIVAVPFMAAQGSDVPT